MRSFHYYFYAILLIIFESTGLALVAVVDGRVLTRCELAREMFQLGIEKSDLATWTCIARFESKLNTSAIGQLNGKWSNNFGLFQVSDRYWCTSSSIRPSANMCHQICQELLTDNIDAAVECAQTVKQRQGWKAWSAYNGYCQHIAHKLTSSHKAFKVRFVSNKVCFKHTHHLMLCFIALKNVETVDGIFTIYGSGTMTLGTVHNTFERFRAGNIDLKDEENRTGRPITAGTDLIIKIMVVENSRDSGCH
uniref:Glycosyl hydrolases family 22 (GH22) domain-containing protein n=1 Tax=Glossina palpalis gambiensis TaxID=67801 RepID=A0A1B0ART3_9MUSC